MTKKNHISQYKVSMQSTQLKAENVDVLIALGKYSFSIHAVVL